MYTLYHNTFSQHSRRVVALLEEAGLPCELKHVALDRGEHLSPEYLRINPNHQVPTFIDGDLRIYESNAILRYLCVKHGLQSWYPSSPGKRAMVEQWLDWNQCRLSPAVVEIVLNRVFLGEEADATAIARGEKQLEELASILESALGSSSFLAGESVTIADLSVASNLSQLDLAKAAPTSSAITSWRNRVEQLEGVKRSTEALEPVFS